MTSIYNVLGWHNYTTRLRTLQQLQLMIGLKPRMVLMEAWMVCPVSSLALSFWLNELGHPKEWARWMLEMGSNWKEQESRETICGHDLNWFDINIYNDSSFARACFDLCQVWNDCLLNFFVHSTIWCNSKIPRKGLEPSVGLRFEFAAGLATRWDGKCCNKHLLQMEPFGPSLFFF